VNTNLLTVLQHITVRYGRDVLNDSRRVNALFADLAKDEPRPAKRALIAALDAGFFQALRNAGEAGRGAAITDLARRLHQDEGYDLALCTDTLELFAAALSGQQQVKPETAPQCASCGKALQEDWAVCPYCGAAYGAARPSAPQSAPPQSPSKPAAPSAVPAAPVTPPKPAAAQKQSAQTAAPAQKHTRRNVLIAAGVAAALITVIAGVAVYQQRPVPVMVRIPGGTFTMGSPVNEAGRFNNEVQHQVTVSSFSMGNYEVTQKEWREVMGNNRSYFKGDHLPVENVSWHKAVEYCNKRSQREGLTPAYTISGTNVNWNRNANGYRLPTEAEWEYACRAGTSGPFSTGNNITTGQANYDGNFPYSKNAKGTYREKTVEVGSFAPNRWGLYNIHGNVYEWCWDWYGDYPGGAQTDPAGPSTGAHRVFRGGSWDNGARYLRSAYRHRYAPTDRYNNPGFRLVRSW
jgi:formylglycine-generating enzyme required for sulfatase activity